MKTYKIKSQKDLDKFKDEYGYKIDGNAEFSYSANFTGRLYVEGSLSIKAGESTEAEKTITCSKLLKGNIEYGNLVETGEPEEEKITIKISKSSLQALKDSGIEVIND